MGVTFVSRLVLGVDAASPGLSGRSFVERVMDGEFGQFEGNQDDLWRALEEHFVENEELQVYAACDEFTGDASGAVVGIIIQEVESQGEDEASAGLTEQEFLQRLKQAQKTLASVGLQAPKLFMVPYTG